VKNVDVWRQFGDACGKHPRNSVCVKLSTKGVKLAVSLTMGTTCPEPVVGVLGDRRPESLCDIGTYSLRRAKCPAALRRTSRAEMGRWPEEDASADDTSTLNGQGEDPFTEPLRRRVSRTCASSSYHLRVWYGG
jgi:hypothetical protein